MTTTKTDAAFEYVAEQAQGEVSYMLGQHAPVFIRNQPKLIALVFLRVDGTIVAGIIEKDLISNAVKSLAALVDGKHTQAWTDKVTIAAAHAVGSPPESIPTVIAISGSHGKLRVSGGTMLLDHAAFLAGLPPAPSGQN